ncbi:MAG UNVERIFIED_CONTAM: hypothetical protein LVR18_46360 [Planctomycetaceae bacterium]
MSSYRVTAATVKFSISRRLSPKPDRLQATEATAEFERLWQSGERPDWRQFMLGYRHLPPGLLDTELRALRAELQGEACQWLRACC